MFYHVLRNMSVRSPLHVLYPGNNGSTGDLSGHPSGISSSAMSAILSQLDVANNLSSLCRQVLPSADEETRQSALDPISTSHDDQRKGSRPGMLSEETRPSHGLPEGSPRGDERRNHQTDRGTGETVSLLGGGIQRKELSVSFLTEVAPKLRLHERASITLARPAKSAQQQKPPGSGNRSNDQGSGTERAEGMVPHEVGDEGNGDVGGRPAGVGSSLAHGHAENFLEEGIVVNAGYAQDVPLSWMSMSSGGGGHGQAQDHPGSLAEAPSTEAPSTCSGYTSEFQPETPPEAVKQTRNGVSTSRQEGAPRTPLTESGLARSSAVAVGTLQENGRYAPSSNGRTQASGRGTEIYDAGYGRISPEVTNPRAHSDRTEPTHRVGVERDWSEEEGQGIPGVKFSVADNGRSGGQSGSKRHEGLEINEDISELGDSSPRTAAFSNTSDGKSIRGGDEQNSGERHHLLQQEHGSGHRGTGSARTLRQTFSDKSGTEGDRTGGGKTDSLSEQRSWSASIVDMIGHHPSPAEPAPPIQGIPLDLKTAAAAVPGRASDMVNDVQQPNGPGGQPLTNGADGGVSGPSVGVAQEQDGGGSTSDSQALRITKTVGKDSAEVREAGGSPAEAIPPEEQMRKSPNVFSPNHELEPKPEPEPEPKAEADRLRDEDWDDMGDEDDGDDGNWSSWLTGRGGG